MDLWLRDAGASTELLTWFGHDPEKWEEFRRRYVDEIRGGRTSLRRFAACCAFTTR